MALATSKAHVLFLPTLTDKQAFGTPAAILWGRHSPCRIKGVNLCGPGCIRGQAELTCASLLILKGSLLTIVANYCPECSDFSRLEVATDELD